MWSWTKETQTKTFGIRLEDVVKFGKYFEKISIGLFEHQNSWLQLVYKMSSSEYCFLSIWFKNIFLKQKSSCNYKKMAIFSFSNPILLGSTKVGRFIDNTFFLIIWRKDFIEVILCIIRPRLFDSHSKSSFDHFVKIGKYYLYLIFVWEERS